MSTREAGGATVRHENADKVRRSRGVLPPFSQPQFLFCFIPSLLGCFCIRVSMLVIFLGRIRLLKLPACVLERQTPEVFVISEEGMRIGGENKSKNVQ